MLRLPVEVNGKYGYVDEHGEIAIPLQYDLASEFSEGLARVMREKTAIEIIDMGGNVQGTLENAWSYSDFSEGLLAYFEREDRERGESGYLDAQARVVIPPRFSAAFPFVDGRAVVEVGRKHGIIDRQGDWVVEPQFYCVLTFEKGEATTPFAKGEQWGFINRDGEVVLEPRYRDAMPTYQGLTGVWVGTEADESCGVVDVSGQWVIPPKFRHCGGFHDDTIPVAVDDKWGVVDLQGNWIIPPKYTSANAFHDGLSRVYVGGGRNEDYCLEDGKFGFVDRNDKLVIRAKFDDAEDFKDGVARVKKFPRRDPYGQKTKTGWIDTTGKFIWKPSR
ncbi:MAG: WG repeat-containing protein [Planctomycetes bacterium]|nr:WG repeat-containing protein [Planctomycetota bacterium]